MNCDKAQELIFTDYIDGEMKPELKDQLEAHISGCQKCRKLLATCRESAVEIFDGFTEQKTPEHVWQSLRERLKQAPKYRAYDFLSGLHYSWSSYRNLFPEIRIPYLRLVSVFALTMLLTVALHLYKVHNLAVASKEEAAVQHLAYLMGYDAELSNGYGTDIEEYFL